MDRQIKPSRWRSLWPGRDGPAQALLAHVIQASRQPDFFGDGRIADSVDGRLELIFLHMALLLRRLRADEGSSALAQTLTDRFFRHLDEGFREVGVGDLSVPKTMKRVAGQFYGRLEAYDRALDAADLEALREALARNFGAALEPSTAFQTALAAHAAALSRGLAATPTADLATASAWRFTTA